MDDEYSSWSMLNYNVLNYIFMYAHVYPFDSRAKPTGQNPPDKPSLPNSPWDKTHLDKTPRTKSPQTNPLPRTKHPWTKPRGQNPRTTPPPSRTKLPRQTLRTNPPG